MFIFGMFVGVFFGVIIIALLINSSDVEREEEFKLLLIENIELKEKLKELVEKYKDDEDTENVVKEYNNELDDLKYNIRQNDFN